uniref:Riboflavin transporter n=1 Tax=Syphacia muris TaxID=451379 RepID=A0A0N5AVK4_9BILA
MPSAVLKHIAVAAFGLGTWLSINSVFVQLPLFVNVVPEQWNLSTYIVLIVQISCFFPLIYGYFDWKYRHKNDWCSRNRTILIPAMLLMAAGGLIMAAFVYDKPCTVAGGKHSYLLFVAFFIMSMPCTVSDVMFMPYITRFNGTHIVTTFFVGMGLSALVPSAVSLVQGYNVQLNGTAPNGWGPTDGCGLLFGARSFLVFMAAFYGVSFLGFLLLAKQDVKIEPDISTEKHPQKVCDGEISVCIKANGNNTDDIFQSSFEKNSVIIVEKSPEKTGKEMDNYSELKPLHWRLFLMISLVLGALQNSVVPVILPFAMQPYGQNVCDDQRMYHVATSLYVMVNPIFCFLQFFIEFRTVTIFAIWTLFNVAMVMFTFVCALLSFDLSGLGPILCVIFSLASGFISWERTAVAHILRNNSSEAGLFWCGAFTQIGSFLGALLMFLLSNVAHIFE